MGYKVMSKEKALAILNVLSWALAVFVSYWSNAVQFNGSTIGGISAQFQVLFKPADYAFIIWGVIYLALLLFVIYPFLPTARSSNIASRTGIYFMAANVSSALWVLNWHYQNFLFTILLMAVILYCLAQIYARLKVSLEIVPMKKKLFIHLPISLYLSWISVAALANLSIYVEAVGWDKFGMSEPAWFGLLLLAANAVWLWVALTRSDMIFGTVYLWAFWSIAVQNDGIPGASTLSWIAVGLVLAIYIIALVMKIRALIFSYNNGR